MGLDLLPSHVSSRCVFQTFCTACILFWGLSKSPKFGKIIVHPPDKKKRVLKTIQRPSDFEIWLPIFIEVV